MWIELPKKNDISKLVPEFHGRKMLQDTDLNPRPSGWMSSGGWCHRSLHLLHITLLTLPKPVATNLR